MSLNQNLREIIDRYRDSQGNMNYFALMADRSIVDYAESLSGFDLGTLKTRVAQLAFWINSYNALSIYGVVKKLEKDPDFANRGNKSFLSRAKFFAVQKFNVGGKIYTLKTIEDNIRKEFEDPRIHFALNCSSLGCPVARNSSNLGHCIQGWCSVPASLRLHLVNLRRPTKTSYVLSTGF